MECVCLAEAEGLTKEEIVKDYKDVFSAGPAAWRENTTSRWTVRYQQYRIDSDEFHLQAVEEKLKAMEKDGWITKVDTSTGWISIF